MKILKIFFVCQYAFLDERKVGAGFGGERKELVDKEGKHFFPSFFPGPVESMTLEYQSRRAD